MGVLESLGKHATKAGAFTPVGIGLSAVGTGMAGLAGHREAQGMNAQLQALRGTYIPTVADNLAYDRKRQEAVQRLSNMDPETLEHFRWLLSGQRPPQITDTEIQVGEVPSNTHIMPNDLIEGMMAMMDE